MGQALLPFVYMAVSIFALVRGSDELTYPGPAPMVQSELAVLGILVLLLVWKFVRFAIDGVTILPIASFAR
jgi:uncharacterized membrane protein YphA (DoxX/SURF4 family)